MNKKEAAIVSAYTGFLIGDFGDFHEYAEKIMERPIFTHEFANKKIVDKIHQKSKGDFLNIKIEDDININLTNEEIDYIKFLLENNQLDIHRLMFAFHSNDPVYTEQKKIFKLNKGILKKLNKTTSINNNKTEKDSDKK